MSEKQTENGKKSQSNETGGLSFAVTLLAALGTISYAGYIYVQQTPLDIILYVFFCVSIPPALILVICLLFYVLFKGYSIEVLDSEQKNRLNKLSSTIYRMSLSMFAMLFIFMLYVTALVLLSPKIEILTVWITVWYNLLFLLIIGIMLSIFIYWLLNKKSQLKQKSVWTNYITPGGTLLLVGMLFGSAVFPCVVDLTPLQGHVTVDMESIYYKNDAPIPVLIHVTGPITNLSIELDNSTTKVYNLELTPERNLSKTEFSNNSILIGNALNYGTYNVFINTTNLSAGYYELMCTRQGYDKTYGARGFYLVNSSRQSGIKE